MKTGYVYIITNYKNTTFYTGVASDIVKRVYEHKNKLIDGFSKKYNLNKLIYYEVFDDISDAINREKEIKGKSRQYKIDLINTMNPDWHDMYDSIL